MYQLNRVLQDPLLEPFFKNVNLTRQRQKQKAFMNHVFGKRAYHGKDMRKAHAHLHLTDLHFDRVALHLTETLAFLGIKKDLIDQVLEVVETTRNDVLNRDASPPTTALKTDSSDSKSMQTTLLSAALAWIPRLF